MEASGDQGHYAQLRLLIEDLCCDLCRFQHVKLDKLAPEQIQLDREYCLGRPDAFADIRVQPLQKPAYFVEVKNGYSKAELLHSLRRKYGPDSNRVIDASKVVLVFDAENHADWVDFELEVQRCLDSKLCLEVWNEHTLLSMLQNEFNVAIDSISKDDLLDVSHAIEQAKGYYAFGGPSPDRYQNTPLCSELLWQFGFWQLARLREQSHRSPRDILPPGWYRDVAVVVADLSSFSSFVRDTRDNEIIRRSLTAFYSKSRYQILNNQGMLYQFVGDEAIGLFGIPDRQPGFIQHAVSAAKALLNTGASVMHNWQRSIDRVQPSHGAHVGIALGDIQVVALRPFSRTRMSGIGDSINVAARLMSAAAPNQIVISNSFYNELDEQTQSLFTEIEPVEARNVGTIKAWCFGESARNCAGR